MKDNFPLVIRVQPENRLHQHCLPCAVLSDQPEDMSLLNLKRYVLQYRIFLIPLLQMPDIQNNIFFHTVFPPISV